MTIKEIVKYIADREGKKIEVSVGNIREILAILSDLLVDEDAVNMVFRTLVANGKRRAKKKR